MPKKILVVDDEPSISTLLKFNLEKNGYSVILGKDGLEAIQLVKEESPDLLILDLMLPELDGMEVCKNLRQNQYNLPILMLTARDDDFDKVLGLELGADDYMTKPFNTRELIARVKAILRRYSTPNQDQKEMEEEQKIKVGNLIIEEEKYEAYHNSELLELTPKEFELLLYLAKHKNKVLTRDQLLDAVWNYDFAGDTRIVDVHISHLREKIELDTRQPQYIKTVRGIGYKFGEPKNE